MKEFLPMVPYSNNSILVPRTEMGRIARDFAVLAMAAIGFVAVAILCLMVSVAEAAQTGEKRSNSGGGLFITPSTGTMMTIPAPKLKTGVTATVTGMIARVTVAQTFVNPAQTWVEGVYVFPLSDKAAVDHLVMKIGDKVVEGAIQERKAAKRHYQTAKRTGRHASLVEQERPNIFTVSVANIPPKAEISVEITYQEALPMEDGLVSLRLPQVLTQRYIPGNIQVAGLSGTGMGINTSDVADAERISPPVRDPSLTRLNPLSLEVLLDPGMPLASIKSRYHQVSVREVKPTHYQVALRQGTAPADRDFVLDWRPEPGDAPKTALFAEQKDGATYLLAMIVPPNVPSVMRPANPPPNQRTIKIKIAPAAKGTLPREVIFIIDTSGSMHGESIKQAADALHFAIGKLSSFDSFNIIAFSDRPMPLFGRPKMQMRMRAARPNTSSINSRRTAERSCRKRWMPH
jgi:Ca-activated chloride channel homolog